MSTHSKLPSSVAECHAEIKALRVDLAVERTANKHLHEEFKKMQQNFIAMNVRQEQEEESHTIQLLKKLDQMRREKERIALQIDEEEECISNNLQRKLAQLQQDKVALENKLEQEQEYITNKLGRKIDAVLAEKRELESKLAQSSSALIERLQESVEKLQRDFTQQQQQQSNSQPPSQPTSQPASQPSSRPTTPTTSSRETPASPTSSVVSFSSSVSAPSLIAQMAVEIEKLTLHQKQFDRSVAEYQSRNARLEEELARLKNSNFTLEQKVASERRKSDHILAEKTQLAQEWEFDDERQFNLETRELSSASVPTTPTTVMQPPSHHNSLSLDSTRQPGQPVLHRRHSLSSPFKAPPTAPSPPVVQAVADLSPFHKSLVSGPVSPSVSTSSTSSLSDQAQTQPTSTISHSPVRSRSGSATSHSHGSLVRKDSFGGSSGGLGGLGRHVHDALGVGEVVGITNHGHVRQALPHTHHTHHQHNHHHSTGSACRLQLSPKQTGPQAPPPVTRAPPQFALQTSNEPAPHNAATDKHN